MSRVMHLKRRPSGVYVVRFVVPPWLRTAVGQRELHQSTGCRDVATAKAVAADLAARWHGRLLELRNVDPTKIKNGTVELIGDGYMPLREAAAALGTTPEKLATRLRERHARFFVEAVAWRGWLFEDLTQIDFERDDLGQIESIVFDEGRFSAVGLQTTLNRTLRIFFLEDVAAALRGATKHPAALFEVPPSREQVFVRQRPEPIAAEALLVRRTDVESLRRSLAASITPAMIEVPPQPARAASTDDDADSAAKAKHRHKPLADLTKFYLDAKTPQWGLDEQRRQADACSALVELSGNPPLGQVDRDSIWAVARALGRLPQDRRRHRKLLGDRPPTWTHWIAIADEHDLPRASPTAVERLLEDMTGALEWGKRQGWLRENPASGIASEVFKSMGGVRVAAHQRRDAFTDADLAQIFAAEWFAQGAGRRTNNGTFYHYRPYYYWLPLLGLHVGGRINELAQLHLSDVRLDPDGGWYLDFNLEGEDKVDADETDADALEGKSLKTASANRVVPLHPKLIELGLIDYVKALRSAGYKRLFPELKFDKVKGYGKEAGKWFNDRYLGKALGLERNRRKVFHSLRHNFATMLERASTPDPAVKQLMGHSMHGGPSAGATPGYQKPRSVAELRPYIEALQPAIPAISRFDVDAGLEAVRDALKLKQSHGPR